MRALRSRNSYIAKPDLVSTTLIDPVTLTGDDSSTNGGLAIAMNSGAGLGQSGFETRTSGGTRQVFAPNVGGPLAFGLDMRCYSAAGGSYAAFNGSQTVPCLELPDGTSAQGAKLWSGTGAPSSTTVGTAAVGDMYWRLFGATPATLVAGHQGTSGSTVTSITVGSGSNLKSGNAVAGDLLVIALCNTVLTETMTCGADSGITDTSTDGGALYNDGTRRIHVFSRVIQSGDISANAVTASAFTNNTGTGRRLYGFIWHHEFGWNTTGSKHGGPLYASDNNGNATTNTSGTRSVTGPSGPSISLSAIYQAGASLSPTFLWDGGSSSNTSPDGGGGSTASAVGLKPGLGTNTSGATGYSANGSSVALGSLGTTTATILANYQVSTTVPSANILYRCTVAGTPGTWVAVF